MAHSHLPLFIRAGPPQRRSVVTITKRVLQIVLLCSLLGLVANAQLPQFTPFSADMQVSSTSARSPLAMDGKLHVAEGHMRLDADSKGHQTAIITDFATKTVDILMIQQKMYMEHQMGASGPGMMNDPTTHMKPFDPNNPCAAQPDLTCKKIGNETVSGRSCEHWELTGKDGKVVNVWLDKSLRWPVKTVSGDTTILLTNIVEGPQDPSMFKIPAGFQKFDMGNMMRQGAGPSQ